MSPTENEYGAHAAQMKYALRSAKKRYDEAGVASSTVPVRSFRLVSTNPPRSSVSSRNEEAVHLNVDGVVFLPLSAQLGVPCVDNEGEYSCMQATEFVAERTKGINDDDQAFDVLEPYYRAIMNL